MIESLGPDQLADMVSGALPASVHTLVVGVGSIPAPLINVPGQAPLVDQGKWRHVARLSWPNPVAIARAAALRGLTTFVLVAPGVSGTDGPVVASDHINLSGSNPLTGPNQDRFGVRFPDMTEPYDPKLRALLGDIGPEVVVAGLTDEATPQDLVAVEGLGAQAAVGGAVVHGILAARHAGLRCALVVAPAGKEDAVLQAVAHALEAAGQG
ncbi:MAG: hypothetical protein JJ896_18005 [Rhodothermales bacterium]|nr:hypothetical protein [Rhodothermales bacterium]MBO6781558.1 hypothetical protein [Rhodothermales bacterium]